MRRLVLTLMLGCIEQRAYPCSESAQCRLADIDGRCEVEGWCSYPDPDCASGWRFESLAPEGLGGECVDATTACSSGPCVANRLVVGDTHTCVVDQRGELFCWGDNGLGQLGRDSTIPSDRCPEPVQGPGRIELASAWRHTCVFDNEDSIWCWGDNDVDKVDWHDGVADVVPAPREIVGLPGVPTVADVGAGFSCGANGTTVACWGRLPEGESVPAEVVLPAAVTMLAVGDAHVCALGSDAAVYCVGAGTNGQLGDGTLGGFAEPSSPTVPVTNAVAIAAGPNHTCAAVDNSVVCWGLNDAGQCGSPPEMRHVLSPTNVTNLGDGGPFLELALGERHSCARGSDLSVQCWGEDSGVPSEPIYGARRILDEGGDPINALEIGAGSVHTCARTSTTAVTCWGDNGSFQLGASSSQLTRHTHTVQLGCD